jgi:hypothetical protein
MDDAMINTLRSCLPCFAIFLVRVGPGVAVSDIGKETIIDLSGNPADEDETVL